LAQKPDPSSAFCYLFDIYLILTQGCDNRPMEWIAMALAAMHAGGIDAIAGGGGLVMLPALFAAYPTTAAATLLGTKFTNPPTLPAP
jgi:hypothetical protein